MSSYLNWSLRFAFFLGAVDPGPPVEGTPPVTGATVLACLTLNLNDLPLALIKYYNLI